MSKETERDRERQRERERETDKEECSVLCMFAKHVCYACFVCQSTRVCVLQMAASSLPPALFLPACALTGRKSERARERESARARPNKREKLLGTHKHKHTRPTNMHAIVKQCPHSPWRRKEAGEELLALLRGFTCRQPSRLDIL